MDAKPTNYFDINNIFYVKINHHNNPDGYEWYKFNHYLITINWNNLFENNLNSPVRCVCVPGSTL